MNLTGTQTITRHTQLFSQNHDKDYDIYSSNVRPGDHSSHSSLGGIEVTTEMSVMEEVPLKNSTSEHRLVMDA